MRPSSYSSLLCSLAFPQHSWVSGEPAPVCDSRFKPGTRSGKQQRNSASIPACSFFDSLFLITIPLLLNAATVTGFTLISAIVGGQAIASLNPDNVSITVGIVITCLVSFVASLMGYKALHWWERWTWIPNLISLVIAVGCGGKYLHLQSEFPPATAASVLSYGGLIAGYFITFGGTVSDYTLYHDPAVSK